MPTENRSSNTEMVSAKVCGYTPGQSQVELRLPKGCNLPSWLELGNNVVVASVIPAQQHHGEPVEICVMQRAAGAIADTTRKLLDQLEEVGRLRVRVEELEKHCKRLGQGDAERYWEGRWRDADNRLAKRDELLQIFIENSDDTDVVELCQHALSASAEPSAPKLSEPVIPGHRLDALEALIADGDPHSDANVSNLNVAELISAVRTLQVRSILDEPSAPVEIDVDQIALDCAASVMDLLEGSLDRFRRHKISGLSSRQRYSAE